MFCFGSARADFSLAQPRGTRVGCLTLTYSTHHDDMALNQGLLAENIRRLAGMHLVPMDRLASFIGVSRQAVANMVSQDSGTRSLPKAGTVIRLAEAFNVPLNSLYQDPETCLRNAIDGFTNAPIRSEAHVPDSLIERLSTKLAVA